MAIILDKTGDQYRINLEKGNTSFQGEIKINLNWSKGGFFKQMLGGAVDLDLGCFYELHNGKKQLIDGLQFAHGQGGLRNQQTRQGSYDFEPFIWHKGDDRGGSTKSGETILINPAHINDIKRIIVYTFIYEGVVRWSETNAVIEVSVPGNEDVIVAMGEQVSSEKFCAIAELTFGGDNSISVKKLVTFHGGHESCDKVYGWGFQYRAGSK